MKEFYRIHELSGLFGLCPDTLRYYEEKGLLHPARGENRYRMYGIQDVITLNIVRSLRELGMTVEDIRTYLERRSVEETLALLEEEERLLLRRMEELERTRRQARRRQARLERYAAVEAERVEFLYEEERSCVFLQEDIILEGEIDFLLKKLEHRHQDYIKIIGDQCMGAAVDGESLKQGVYNHFSRVFFLTEPGLPSDGVLPAGSTRAFFTGAATARCSGIIKRCSRRWRRRAAGRPGSRWSSTGSTPTTPTGKRNMSPNCRCRCGKIRGLFSNGIR